jgi:hypothetical protein
MSLHLSHSVQFFLRVILAIFGPLSPFDAWYFRPFLSHAHSKQLFPCHTFLFCSHTPSIAVVAIHSLCTPCRIGTLPISHPFSQADSDMPPCRKPTSRGGPPSPLAKGGSPSPLAKGGSKSAAGKVLRSRCTLSTLSSTTSEVSASSTPPRRSSPRKDPPEAVADTPRASSARRTSSRIHHGTRDE